MVVNDGEDEKKSYDVGLGDLIGRLVGSCQIDYIKRVVDKEGQKVRIVLDHPHLFYAGKHTPTILTHNMNLFK
jgi:hypothetical protein